MPKGNRTKGRPHLKPGHKHSHGYLAEAIVYFLEHINGHTMTQIARDHKHSKKYVSTALKKVSELLADAGKEKIMLEIFPLALEVYKAELKWQLDQYALGKQPDTTKADRIFKGLFILDHAPQQKDEAVESGAADTVETLTGFQIKRLKKKAEEIPAAITPEIEGEVITDVKESGK